MISHIIAPTCAASARLPLNSRLSHTAETPSSQAQHALLPLIQIPVLPVQRLHISLRKAFLLVNKDLQKSKVQECIVSHCYLTLYHGPSQPTHGRNRHVANSLGRRSTTPHRSIAIYGAPPCLSHLLQIDISIYYLCRSYASPHQLPFILSCHPLVRQLSSLFPSSAMASIAILRCSTPG